MLVVAVAKSAMRCGVEISNRNRIGQEREREGHEFTRADQAPIRIAASAAEVHASSLNPGNAEL